MPTPIDRQGQVLQDDEASSVLRLDPGAAATLDQSILPSFDALAGINRIDIYFAHFTDGRGYSVAKLLRERLSWAGDLRAVGDVTVDQIAYLARCGFNQFALRDDQDLADARPALKVISQSYQPNYDQPEIVA